MPDENGDLRAYLDKETREFQAKLLDTQNKLVIVLERMEQKHVDAYARIEAQHAEVRTDLRAIGDKTSACPLRETSNGDKKITMPMPIFKLIVYGLLSLAGLQTIPTLARTLSDQAAGSEIQKLAEIVRSQATQIERARDDDPRPGAR